MSHVAHIVRRVDGGGAGGEVLGAGRLDTLQYGFGPFERLYRTADGWICLAAARGDARSPPWARCSTSMLELDLAGTDLADLIADRIEERDTATWLAVFEARRGACSRAGRAQHARLLE